MKVTDVEWDTTPLVAVTFTVNTPIDVLDAEHDNVLVAELLTVTLVGLREQVNVPVPPVSVDVKDTVPVNP